jgi:predicted nucleotidyltransferase
MDKQQALEILMQHQEALRALGVRHAALFGSVARGEQTAQSDVDVLVELDPDLQIGLFEYVGLTDHIAELFAGRAHVADRDGLKPYLRDSVINDAIYAF